MLFIQQFKKKKDCQKSKCFIQSNNRRRSEREWCLGSEQACSYTELEVQKWDKLVIFVFVQGRK